MHLSSIPMVLIVIISQRAGRTSEGFILWWLGTFLFFFFAIGSVHCIRHVHSNKKDLKK